MSALVQVIPTASGKNTNSRNGSSNNANMKTSSTPNVQQRRSNCNKKPLQGITNSDKSFLSVYCLIRKFIGASGSSTVAIDNKIEQAMDLVKSHLMFAVREEVDVLKEKITELVEKISQLEFENGILKASASQETLNKLSQQQQQQQPPQNSIQQNTQTQSPPLQQSSTVHS